MQDKLSFQDIFDKGKEILKKSGITCFDTDAWYLLEYATGMGRAEYFLKRGETVQEKIIAKYFSLINTRASHMPLQYITGSQEFMGLEFKINSHVLIPRQDTETLVEEALKVLEPGMSVLDLCTGSGCVIISLLRQKRLFGTASDISKQALLIAKENARNNRVDVQLVRSNLFQNIIGRYDMIIANPPYIPTEAIASLMPEVKNFEPVEALDGGEDGLDFYRQIVKESGQFLKSNGYLCLEIGHDQGGRVAFLMEENGYRNVKVIKDLAGNARVVRGNLPSVK